MARRKTAAAVPAAAAALRWNGAVILVIKGDRVETFSIKKDGYQASAFEKLIAMAPEIIDKMKKDKYIYIHDDDEDKTEGEDEKA